MSLTHSHHYELHSKPNTFHHRRVQLNKRPPLVRSSSNVILDHTTPTPEKTKKTVRFCDNASLENVRLFLKSQMPKACRSDPIYPKQYCYSLRRSNWPTERRSLFGCAVRFEDIQLESDKPENNKIALTGTCQVANLSYEKKVTVRFSLDDWVTFKEVSGVYKEPIASSANTWDRFSFKITLNASQHIHETINVAIKYNANGKEFWDNNNNKNYKLDLLPQVQLEIPSSDELSSSSDEDDDNVFEDCNDQEADEIEKEAPTKEKEIGALIKRFEPLSLAISNYANNNNGNDKINNTRLSDRYDFDSAKITPWSPPLSPTTPADCSSPWVSDVTAATTNHHSASYFMTGKHTNNQTKPISPELSPTSEFKSIQDLIQNYCFYSNRRDDVHYPHSNDPIRPSSPRAIRG